MKKKNDKEREIETDTKTIVTGELAGLEGREEYTMSPSSSGCALSSGLGGGAGILIPLDF